MALWIIQCIDQNAFGKRPYWQGGDLNDWVDERAFASRYSDKQKAKKIKDDQVPDRGAWIAIPLTLENFTAEYELELSHLVKKGDCDFGYDGVKQRAKERIDAMREGEGTIGDPIKAVAKHFGIPATQGGIQKALNAPGFR